MKKRSKLLQKVLCTLLSASLLLPYAPVYAADEPAEEQEINTEAETDLEDAASPEEDMQAAYEADSDVKWPVPAANWYEEYEYTKDDAGHILYLNLYKEGQTPELLVVPATATIGGVNYSVVLDNKNETLYGWSLWLKAATTLKGIKIEEGVKAKCGESLFGQLSHLTTLDVSKLDTSGVTSMNNMFSGCYELTSLDVSNFDTSKVTDMSGMFSSLKVTNLDLSNFNTASVTSMDSMFYYNENLTALDLSSFDTSSVTNMSSMFHSCEKLASINFGEHFNTSKVKRFDAMFHSCWALKNLDVSGFDTSSGEDLSCMFYSCSNLQNLDVSHFDLSHAEDIGLMFAFCEKIKTLEFDPDLSTPNLNDMGGLFENCEDLVYIDLSPFDTASVDDMSSMFEDCKELKQIVFGDNFSTVGVTNMTSMFRYCMTIESIDLSHFNTSNVKNMREMFQGCFALPTLNLSKFNTTNVEDMDSMFQQCSALRTLDLSSFDTSKVKDMEEMFLSCSRLTSVNLSSFDTSNVMKFHRMFWGCLALKVLDLRNFDFSKGTFVYDGRQAFIGSSGITHLYLPVNAMSGFDFVNDYGSSEIKLINIFYAGTKEQWDVLGNVLPEGTQLTCEFEGEVAAPDPDETIKITSIRWNKNELTLKAGDFDWVGWKVEPENATDQEMRFTSTDPRVACVLQDKMILAINPGTVTLSVIPLDGSNVSADITVTVAPADRKYVTKISLNKNKLDLKAGASETLTATVEPSDAEDKRIEWSSSDEAVATVDQSGKVTAIANGSAYIYARAKDGSNVSGYCIVKVGGGSEPGPGPVEPSEPIPGSGEATDPQPVVENVASQSITLVKGQKFLLADKDWKVSSSTPKGVVSVSKGNVTAKKAGTATLKRGSGENEQSITITVLVPVIEKTEKTLKLEAGAEAQLSFSGKKAVDGTIAFTEDVSLPVRFVSAAPDVATVDGDGNVSALTKGSAAITAYINGVAHKFTVKVSEQASPLTRTVHLNLTKTKNVRIKGLSKTEWVLAEGETEGIVDIIKGSKVKALTPGTVTLKCGDYTMTVIAEDPSISGSSKPYAMKAEMKVGETKPVSLTAVEQDVFFKSSKSSVAYMDAEGVIHARSKGKAKLSAKVNGRTVSITVTVK